MEWRPMRPWYRLGTRSVDWKCWYGMGTGVMKYGVEIGSTGMEWGPVVVDMWCGRMMLGIWTVKNVGVEWGPWLFGMELGP